MDEAIKTQDFEILDNVYLDSPFGRYTGVVKDIRGDKVTIESQSPMSSGSMLADYDINDNEWFK